MTRGVINRLDSGTVLGRPAKEGESPVHDIEEAP